MLQKVRDGSRDLRDGSAVFKEGRGVNNGNFVFKFVINESSDQFCWSELQKFGAGTQISDGLGKFCRD